MRATIKDVSREAGVSIKTVSRVLNGERYVGAATAERVRAAVATLNFRPSLAARSLAGRRSFQIALVCDNPSPWYVFQMQLGIRDRCATDGVRMIAQPYDRGSDRLIDDIEALIDTTSADGLVLTPPITDRLDLLDMLDTRSIPYVRVSPKARPGASSSTFIDNEAAAAAMTNYLIALGHQRIALVSGHPDFAASHQRAAGYAQALVEGGIARMSELEMPGSYTFESGFQAGAKLLGLVDRPTAVFAANDDMAAGVLAAAHMMGIRVPDQLSVAGFGDDALAGYVWPPLTTIRQPLRDLAWNAADLLLSPPEAHEQRQMPFELVLRGSTAPLNR